ncbi:MAG TPA: hypothetical protein VFQ61_06455 [Polyangiaceae bacterium]|nr:hypothetical protein [Polyangiaceae bacterium]
MMSQDQPKKKKSGPSGPSGAHQAARRPVQGSEAQWAAWDAKAARAGLSWAEWVRQLLDEAPGAPVRSWPSSEGPYPGRRLVSASDQQLRAWTRKASAAALSWAEWVRRVQDAA